MHAVEKRVGKCFGDPARPLLVSCRSGAKFSMPGMMDTVLNIGLNDDTASGLVASAGDEHFVFDSYRRLIQMFGTVVLGLRDELFDHVLADARTARGVTSDADLTVGDLRGVVARFRDITPQFPTDPLEQLRMAIEAVFASWNGKRAIDYRNAAGIPHDLGTAVNVQAMVFGNLGEKSATGVTMTRSGATGGPGLEGDFLINAQGEDVVSGTRATRPLDALAERDARGVRASSSRWPRRWSCRYRDMQDIEFTIEDGKLWLLQTRDGKRTAQAAVRIAVDLANEGLISRARRGTPSHAAPRSTSSSMPSCPGGRSRGRRGGTDDRHRAQRLARCRSRHRRLRPRRRPTPRRRRSRGHPGPAGDQARRRARHARRGGDPDHAVAVGPATPPWWPASSASPPSSGSARSRSTWSATEPSSATW